MNTTDPAYVTIGGHRCERTSRLDRTLPVGDQEQFRCLDCGQTASWNGFSVGTVGTDGCPMRPESLDYLSVCPGGELCRTHMDTSTAEWRLRKTSPSMSSDQVPRITCDAALLGVRAARQWLKFADKVGIKTAVWAERAIADRVGAEGGHIANLQTTAGFYHIVVTRHGRLRAHKEDHADGFVHQWNCPDCAELADKGEITRPTL